MCGSLRQSMRLCAPKLGILLRFFWIRINLSACWNRNSKKFGIGITKNCNSGSTIFAVVVVEKKIVNNKNS